MPRILHVIAGLTIGGAEMALYRLVTHSQGGRYKHTVVALTPGGTLANQLRGAGVELITFDFQRAPISQFFSLLSLLRTIRPDIVQTWMYHADMLGGLAARMTGNRNVIWGIRTTSVSPGSCKRSTILIMRLCAWLSRWVPHTIVCVADASRQAHAGIGYDASRMVVVSNGFDLSSLTAGANQRDVVRAQCGFGANDIVIGNMGRFNTDKDQHNFVRAAGMLAQKDKRLRFLMVGYMLDSGNPELARWIAETGHADRFVLLGERTDVPACLAAMDIFCLSSRNEGFPNVLGEAMALGLPCVATDVGDVAMLVADTGLVVPKENSDALAHALNSLVDMPAAKRQQLGQKAKARILAEFTIEHARSRFESIYQRMICKVSQ
jgi:glycosyltransferase involved in cell wall biosynthesis